MNKAIIISGEASETDSEDEELQSVPLSLTASIQGAVITGEDSESENENEGSICSAISALDTSAYQTQDEASDNEKYDSLLHQKLRECNGKLQQDIEHFCQNVLGDAGKKLILIDQHLVKSQTVLQSAVTSLKSLSSNSHLIKNKLQSLLSAQFVPNIKTDN